MRISDWSSDVCSSDLIAETVKPVSVLMFDIDKFKSINDSYGHKGGDEVLIELAKRVSRGVRDIDLVSRYGGEEFVIVMPDADIEVAVAVAERVRGLVADQGFAVSGARSEEHTSELQSLMRISYAVFCLKKNKKRHT